MPIANTCLSLSEAQQLGQALLQRAEREGRAIAVACCGPQGELIYLARMDAVGPASVTIAQNKAYTAARDRQPSLNLGQWLKSSGTQLANWGDPRVTGFGGGVPIWHQGQCIGGLGVSGLAEQEDHDWAQQALALLEPQSP